MTAATMPRSRGRTIALRAAAVLGALIVALALLILFFPWDWLRGPVNRYVSEKTGRHFAITRKLDAKPGFTFRVIADGIEFANPSWAKDPNFVTAEGAEIDIQLLTLLFDRKVVLPRLSLTKPAISMQMETDGRRTWAFGGKDTSDESNVPEIGELIVDEGSLHYLDMPRGADIGVQFGIDSAQSPDLPLSYKAKGTWRKEPFSAQGRTGSVLKLSAPLENPFPLEVAAVAGRTQLKATGTVASLSSLDGANVNFDLQGANLADLYKLVGVVLPATPKYAVRGKLAKQADLWTASGINGRLGSSDIAGNLVFDRSRPVPLLSGKLQSKALDFVDLGPIVGIEVEPRVAPNATALKTSAAQRRSTPKDPARATRKVLPNAPLNFGKLDAMDADVWYSAADIKNVEVLPLESANVHVKLKGGVLRLEQMKLGVAGGTMAGVLQIDSHSKPAAIQMDLDARMLELNKLFPTIPLTQSSLGRLNGKVALQGRGASTAQMLASADGNIALLMGSGRISNILLEFLGLDGGEIIKFLLRGDNTVQLRCAATAFDVKDGLMTSRAFVLDTVDTVVNGTGTISLANETLDLTLKPRPKDSSILSLRSPLRIGGTFAQPSAGPDKGALAGRAGLALALGTINPLLALAATIETGPGKDADCAQVLAEAAKPAAVANGK
jgi:AsmA family protein